MKIKLAGGLLLSTGLAFGTGYYNMALDIGRMAKSMTYSTFTGRCGTANNPGAAVGGYPVGPNVISFDAYQANLGPDQFYVTQTNNDLMVVRVFDMSGNQKTISQKDQFCPEDNGGQISWINYGTSSQGTCGIIPAGWMDNYSGGFGCNLADFGNLSTGTDYSIFAELNPSRSWAAHSPNATERDFDTYRVWLTGNYATSGGSRVFKVKTSLSVGSQTLTSGKRLYYGVHTMNGTGTGKITINSAANFTQTSGVSELGMYAHNVALTNQGGQKTTIQEAGGSKMNIRILGLEQY